MLTKYFLDGDHWPFKLVVPSKSLLVMKKTPRPFGNTGTANTSRAGFFKEWSKPEELFNDFYFQDLLIDALADRLDQPVASRYGPISLELSYSRPIGWPSFLPAELIEEDYDLDVRPVASFSYGPFVIGARVSVPGTNIITVIGYLNPNKERPDCPFDVLIVNRVIPGHYYCPIGTRENREQIGPETGVFFDRHIRGQRIGDKFSAHFASAPDEWREDEARAERDWPNNCQLELVSPNGNPEGDNVRHLRAVR